MTELKIGDTAPNFTMPTNGGAEVSLADYKGQKLVLYFYPKDNTPGCTTESCAFNDALPDFKSLNCAVLGVSKCSVKKHENFAKKYGFNFPLASDENTDTCERYGVWKEKSMYGKKFMGIERSTFLIDETGTITNIWRKVKVKDHAYEVREALKAQ